MIWIYINMYMSIWISISSEYRANINISICDISIFTTPLSKTATVTVHQNIQGAWRALSKAQSSTAWLIQFEIAHDGAQRMADMQRFMTNWMLDDSVHIHNITTRTHGCLNCRANVRRWPSARSNTKTNKVRLSGKAVWKAVSPYRDGYKRLERPPFVCVRVRVHTGMRHEVCNM